MLIPSGPLHGAHSLWSRTHQYHPCSIPTNEPLLSDVEHNCHRPWPICALANQDSKPAQYLLDHIHTAVENLQEKQDKIQNTREFRDPCRNKHKLVAHNRGVINLNIQWVPGHMDFTLNDKADQHAKEATKGQLSPSGELPKSLRKPLLVSVSTLWQE